VYYGDIPSQMKAFVDRTFCYLVPDFMTNPNPSRLPPGKKCVFILTQNHPDEKMFADVYPRYSSSMQWYGFQDSYLIRGTGLMEKGDAGNRPQLLQQAEDLAKKIVA
jgi:multimeric flavodoxin WrbA